jgi:hypothetical protein
VCVCACLCVRECVCVCVCVCILYAYTCATPRIHQTNGAHRHRHADGQAGGSSCGTVGQQGERWMEDGGWELDRGDGVGCVPCRRTKQWMRCHCWRTVKWPPRLSNGPITSGSRSTVERNEAYQPRGPRRSPCCNMLLPVLQHATNTATRCTNNKGYQSPGLHHRGVSACERGQLPRGVACGDTISSDRNSFSHASLPSPYSNLCNANHRHNYLRLVDV